MLVILSITRRRGRLKTGHFIDHGDQWELREKSDPVFYTYFDRIRDNFYCNPQNGCIAGFGIVKIPKGSRQHGWTKAS